MKNIKIKGGTLDVWEKWLEEELTPPYSGLIENNSEVRYTMEAFLELVKKVNKK